MSKLKACPFCGLEPTDLEAVVTCDDGHDEITLLRSSWNERPLEDALNEQIRLLITNSARLAGALRELQKNCNCSFSTRELASHYLLMKQLEVKK